ncbi:MAG: phosphoribosylformimino-5-aminoimidazole carboxamide ribotide isomerase [Lachnospiraceae bacterium]|nr:phosphoribosylformimino-5-aminoimidazole carboxamide ribotide isomerase [Lachnospiraceae bacterium]
MQFRPCIDIHNGKVKQIVGGSLKDEGDFAKENFTSVENADYFARYYQKLGIRGGHVILLNKEGSDYFEATKAQALLALSAYPQGLQVGGGIDDRNAAQYLDAGASHVIVTSYVFRDGQIDYDNLEKLRAQVGRERLVLDLSCRKKNGQYYIVTDRWQKYTDIVLDEKALDFFAGYCSEFLIHAVDVEGKANGIEIPLVEMLGGFEQIPVTYAGGVHDYEDIRLLKRVGKGRVHVTIGSALSLFGGTMEIEKIMELLR